MRATEAHPLVVATDRLPLHDCADPFLGRAHAALMHAVAARDGAWVAATDQPLAPTGWLQPLYVPEQVLTAHRAGYCGTVLEGLYLGHPGGAPPQEPSWRTAYDDVNARYAKRIAELAAPGASVWIHGHALQTSLGMLRRLRPDLRIGFSLHSPFPPAESFLTLAGREDHLAGLASANLVAFQEDRSADNYRRLAPPGSASGSASPAVVCMPVPADAHAVAHLAATTPIQARAARIRAMLFPATTVFLSIGTDDPGDGTTQRLEEFAGLLARGELDARHHVLIHLAPAGAELTPQRAAQRQDTEQLIAQINGQHGRPGHCPVHYQRGDLNLAERTAFYLAADVMLATPIRDRANPDASEYVAAREAGSGRVILSEFSAATQHLRHATVIKPYEPGALAAAMLAVAAECKRRSAAMTMMRQHILASDVNAWTQRFLAALRTERLTSVAPRRILNGRHDQEGMQQLGPASHTGGQLTAAAPHP